MNFWDSSAILPLLVAESDTAEMQSLYQAQPEMVAWWGAPVECLVFRVEMHSLGTAWPTLHQFSIEKTRGIGPYNFCPHCGDI